MSNMGPGYSKGIFDPDGPRNFASAIGDVSTAMGKVVGAFVAMDTKATAALSNIQARLKEIAQLTGQVDSMGASGMSGAGPGWGPPSGQNPGGTGGTQGNPMGVGGPGAQPGFYNPMTTVPMGGVQGASGASQSSQTGGTPNGGMQGSGQGPGAGGGGGAPQVVSQTGGALNGGAQMAARAATSILPAIAGAAGRYTESQMGNVAQAGVFGSQLAEISPGGWTQAKQNKLMVIPHEGAGVGQQLSQSPTDYFQSQYMLQSSGFSVSPGGTGSSAATQGFVNRAQLLAPGVSRSQAAGAFTAMHSSNQSGLMAAGIAPTMLGGKAQDQESTFNSLVTRAFRGGMTGLNSLTGDDYARAIADDSPLHQFYTIAFPGDDGTGWQIFLGWLANKRSFTSTPGNAGKTAPNAFTSPKVSSALTSNTAASALIKTSAKSAAQSQTYAGQQAATEVFNKAATIFSDAVNKLLGAKRSLLGNLAGGATGFMSGFKGVTNILGMIPGLGGGGPAPGGAAALGAFGGGGPASGGAAAAGAGGGGGPTPGGAAAAGAPALIKVRTLQVSSGQNAAFYGFKPPTTSTATPSSMAPTPSGGNAPGNVAQWLTSAINDMGVPMSWLPGLETIAKGESGNDPSAVNTWDSNAKAGHPSKGLLQVIQPTFDAYVPANLKSKGIMDPEANAAAAIGYIKKRYGTVFDVPGVKAVAAGKPYQGYETGSMDIAATGLAMLHKGERVVPSAENKSVSGRYGGSGGVTIHLDFKPGSIVIGSGGPVSSTSVSMASAGSGTAQARSHAKAIWKIVSEEMSKDKLIQSIAGV